MYISQANSFGGWVSVKDLLLVQVCILAAHSGPALAANLDFNTGIEGMDSQEWSVGIFIFLIICILVFTAIVVKFMVGDRTAALKRGEKFLFAWILFGVVVAIIFGALQLLQGRLF